MQDLLLNVRHNVSGSVEHSFKPGSGEELRGIEVSSERAVAAYQKALADFDAFIEANRSTIQGIDEQTARKVDEIRARWKDYRQERESELARKSTRCDQLAAKKRRFWGFLMSESEMVELERLKYASFSYDSFYASHAEHSEIAHLPRLGFETKMERAHMAEKLGVAMVASNTLHMNRREVLEIHAIETGAWLAKTKLSRLLTRPDLDDFY